MIEISKLRQRMSNVNRRAVEYRMTIAEAKILLSEIDELIKEKEKPPEVVVIEPTDIIRIMDGGSL